MPNPPQPGRPSAPDALLRLWILAALALAGLYGWQAWQMRDWPADLPGPQPLRAVQISEYMALFVIVPAAVVALQRWRATRDRLLLLLAAAYGALSVLAHAQDVVLAGEMFRLHIAHAAIALAGIPVAIRALQLR
ncbi:hypothetical protein [Sandarakinorhabdus oryzae]|uniref:hypothetical protein n=1 Tax=Sandarakinorhabdus oryzae TaxID=2675220 RepID=UPI0012E297F7|nr:hypothetical protein [Sandarakinorhabdus oryzae]